MKKTTEGRFYTWFEDETIEEALASHSTDGFETVTDAIEDCLTDESSKSFKVVDSGLSVVFDSKNTSPEFIVVKAEMHNGRFYVQFSNESLVEAVRNHSFGYESLDDALSDTKASGESGEKFKVYNSMVECVYEGEIVDGQIKRIK